MILETGKDLIEFMEKKFSSRQAEVKHRDWQELKMKIIPDYEYNIDTSGITGFQLKARIQSVYDFKIRQLGDICE